MVTDASPKIFRERAFENVTSMGQVVCGSEIAINHLGHRVFFLAFFLSLGWWKPF